MRNTAEGEDRPFSDQQLLKVYWLTYATALFAVVLVSGGGFVHAVWRGRWWMGLAAALLLGVLAFLCSLRWAQLREYRHVPGPSPSFFLGNVKELLAFGHGRRDRAMVALHERYGPVVRLHLAWGSPTYLSISEVWKVLHRRDGDSYRRADRTILQRSLMGLAGGTRHQRHRKVLTPALTARSVQERFYRVEEQTRELMARWGSPSGGTRPELLDDIHRWSAHALGSFLFGSDWEVGEPLGQYFDALTAIEEEISFRTFHPFFVRWIFPRRARRVEAAYRYLYTFLEAVLQRRETRVARSGEEEDAGDLLDLIVRAKRDPSVDGWSQDECVEEMMSMVLGGTDAMSFAMSQALLLLSHNPQAQEQARASMERGGPAADGPVGKCPVRHTLTVNLSFVRQLFYETLRLHPAVPFSSKVCGDQVEEHGIRIPAGTNVMWMKNAVGANGAIFPEPRRFNPDRFAADSEERGSVASFLPFGTGPRHCIGSNLAEQQCISFLASVLRHFRIEPLEGSEVVYRATVSVVPSCLPVRLVPLAEARAQGTLTSLDPPPQSGLAC